MIMTSATGLSAIPYPLVHSISSKRTGNLQKDIWTGYKCVTKEDKKTFNAGNQRSKVETGCVWNSQPSLPGWKHKENFFTWLHFTASTKFFVLGFWGIWTLMVPTLTVSLCAGNHQACLAHHQLDHRLQATSA
jgi:hypothetical protein